MRWLLAIVVVGLAVAGSMMWSKPVRPNTLSTEIQAHPAYPATKRYEVNGSLLSERSLQGSSDTGGVDYVNGDQLAIKAAWLDINSKQAWQVELELDVTTLSTYGGQGEHAEYKVVLGPGADVTITTPHPEWLRHVGNDQMHRITPEQEIPITLVELCGEPLAADDPLVADLALGIENWAVTRVQRNKDAYLRENAAPTARCGSS